MSGSEARGGGAGGHVLGFCGAWPHARAYDFGMNACWAARLPVPPKYAVHAAYEPHPRLASGRSHNTTRISETHRLQSTA